jgi:uncharacterized protein (TIGR04141 family)
MTLERHKFDLKIFQLDKTYSEFRGKSGQEIVNIILNNHEKKFRHKHKDLKIADPKIIHKIDGKFEYWSYCYNQPTEKFYWKIFLPDDLTEDQNFDVVEFSFVLFIKYNSEIYCVISGSGMSVIKKFLHPSFGVEIYQRLAKPIDDIIVEMQTRGIASNISHKKQIFNINQTISETLEYSDVPTKMKIRIRQDLKSKEFKKYDLDPNLALMEVGSYFYLRKRIDFSELKLLIKDIDTILNLYPDQQLTLFSKVKDQELLNKLDNHLKDLIVQDVQLHNEPDKVKYNQNDIIEVVHPSKLEKFYECDKFTVRFKFSRGKYDVELTDRSKLYFECTKHIFESLDNIADSFKIKTELLNLNIAGFINVRQATYGNFFDHITAEVEYYDTKYFKIDGHWYLLEDEYLELMNSDAKEYYTKYRLNEDILLKWPDKKDEDYYNLSHKKLKNYFILDKVIRDNIELCDILTIKDNVAYFVHVKNGFNTKMRDLYVQVILSAKRLSNDLKNKKGVSYLRATLKEYNNRNKKNKIDIDDFIKNVTEGKLKINFVMAFKNNHNKGRGIIDRIDLCKSNIAKYALVQVIKEMQPFKFDINVIDISEL